MKPDFTKMTAEERAAYAAEYKKNNPIVVEWKSETAKQAKKRELRNSESTTSFYGDMHIDEINRMNARKNLPSSLR